MRFFVVLLSAWLLGLSIVVGFNRASLLHTRATTRADAQATWHAVVCSIETSELKSPQVTPAQRIRLVLFWNDLLTQRVGTSPCTTGTSP